MVEAQSRVVAGFVVRVSETSKKGIEFLVEGWVRVPKRATYYKCVYR